MTNNLPKVTCKRVPDLAGPALYYTGPPLEDGKLPAIVYFIAEGQESLCLDPFNQPVAFLADKKVRLFSASVPGHEKKGIDAAAMEHWLERLNAGDDFISSFLDPLQEQLTELIDRDIISTIAVAGLSRGAHIATRLAARDERIKTVLGFSPLTRFDYGRFANLAGNPFVETQHLRYFIPQLVGKKLRYYIGNRDLKVGTEHAFAFIQELTERTYESRIRSPQVELIIFPSIGNTGHGTPPTIFSAGADWIASQ